MFLKLKNFFKKRKKIEKNIANKRELKEIIFDENAIKVLDKNQLDLKVLLMDFSTTHFLGGGTAIALYLGHRKSIDFDFFNDKSQGSFLYFYNRIKKYGFSLEREEVENFNGIQDIEQEEFHFTINQVKFTTFNFFRTLYDDQKILITGDNYILNGLRIAKKEELVSMKLYAIMTRNKWKDAVDLYFLLQDLNLSLIDAISLAKEKYFINLINKGNILEQLISGNWDKTESIVYIIKNQPKDEEIAEFLKNKALEIIKKSESK